MAANGFITQIGRLWHGGCDRFGHALIRSGRAGLSFDSSLPFHRGPVGVTLYMTPQGDFLGMKNENEKGFSLIELLVVVIIIAIVAAIAIPNLLASRRAANEASAISSLRTIHSAQATYQATTGNGVNYAPDFTTLPRLLSTRLLPPGQRADTGSRWVVQPISTARKHIRQ